MKAQRRVAVKARLRVNLPNTEEVKVSCALHVPTYMLGHANYATSRRTPHHTDIIIKRPRTPPDAAASFEPSQGHREQV